MQDNTREQHESYGMIGFSRVTHGGAIGGTNLFASAIDHHHTIVMRIKRATKERSLHEDRYYGGENLIEVEMSPMQFAEVITTLNIGDGVPCTIRRIGKVGIADCPEETMRQTFVEEFASSCAKTTQEASDLVERARELLGQKALKATERKELLEVLQQIAISIKSNLPFIGKQFNEAVDKLTTDAKTSVEAFFLQRLNEFGLQAMQNDLSQHTPIIQIENQKQGD